MSYYTPFWALCIQNIKFNRLRCYCYVYFFGSLCYNIYNNELDNHLTTAINIRYKEYYPMDTKPKSYYQTEIPIEDKGAEHLKLLATGREKGGAEHFRKSEFKSMIGFEKMLLSDDEVPDILAVIWLEHFPIDVYTSRKIASKAARMPKEHIRSVVFPLYPLMTDSQEEFFDLLVAFGAGVGLDLVSAELFEGARSGDPRAVKMYLEMQSYISGLGVESEEIGPKGGLSVSFDITGALPSKKT